MGICAQGRLPGLKTLEMDIEEQAVAGCWEAFGCQEQCSEMKMLKADLPKPDLLPPMPTG